MEIIEMRTYKDFLKMKIILNSRVAKVERRLGSEAII